MLIQLLNDYRPTGETEQADLRRSVRLAESTADPWSRALPLHVTASAVVVHPATRRVLLRWHPRMGQWLQVGGHGDPGEGDPLAIALREGREETGLADLRAWPDAALVHLVICDVPAAGDEPAHEHADLRFVLATGDPEAIRPESADAPLRWLTVAQARSEAAGTNLDVTLERVGGLLQVR